MPPALKPYLTRCNAAQPSKNAPVAFISVERNKAVALNPNDFPFVSNDAAVGLCATEANHG